MSALWWCRDLSKPVGALNPKRLRQFRERFVELRVRLCPSVLYVWHCGGMLGAPVAGLLACRSYVAPSQAIGLLCMQKMAEPSKLPGAPPPLTDPPFLYGKPTVAIISSTCMVQPGSQAPAHTKTSASQNELRSLQLQHALPILLGCCA